MNSFRPYLAPLLFGAGALALWQAVSMRYSSEQFPAPLQVAQAIRELASGGQLAEHVAVSLFRFAAAYTLAAVAAVPLGLWLGRHAWALAASNPLIQLVRPISPIAWFPLAVLWFGIGNAPAIFIIFLSAFFPMLLATIRGVRSVPPVYFRVAANFGASQGMVFLRVVLPSAFPSIATGLRIAIGTAWIHLVAGEMLGAQSGLGFLIVDARNFLRTDLILAGMLLVGILGLIIDGTVEWLESRVLRRWGMA